MNRDDLRVGISAGILAATATAGALIAIGSRGGATFRPFNMIGGHLFGVHRADAFDFDPLVTVAGIIVHLILTTVAGVVVAFVSRRRIAPAWMASTVVATLAILISVGIARRGEASLARLLTLGDLVLFYGTLAVSLAIGTRLAFFDRTTDRARRIDSM